MNDPGWGRNQNQNGDNQRPDNQRPERPGSGDGPPDLDELWRDMNQRLNSLFGRGGGNGQGPRGGGGEGGPTMRGALIGLAVLALVGVILWMASGIYIIREGQSSVELRFGKFVRQKDNAGLTARWPYPIETNEIVNTQQLRTVEVGYRNGVRNKNLRESLMLTSDLSIVDMQFAMQYRVGNAKAFLFNNRMGLEPEEIVRQAGEAAMREVVGRSLIDRVLFEEKELVAKEAGDLAQSILDRYGLEGLTEPDGTGGAGGAGVSLVDVTVQQVQPPEQVQNAFEDANKAGQDRQRLINEGRAYRNRVIPVARGDAERMKQEAEGYRAAVVAEAEGDSDRFSKLLTEYSKAPKVTRDRLYLETMQEIMSRTSKVYIDSSSSNNMMYLPLDKILQQGQQPAASTAPVAPVTPTTLNNGDKRGPSSTARDRDSLRGGRGRESFR
ncbi:MAG: FtsH protease activity modulator HflK [Burkholderiaceae bacterium]